MHIRQDEHSPQFSYSVGLFKTYKHPEIIVFGLDEDVAHGILNALARRIKAGEKFEAGTMDNKTVTGFDVLFEDVSAEGIRERMRSARWFNGSVSFPAVQLFWPDENGIFPTDDKRASDILKRTQPSLAPKRKTH